MLDKQYVYVVLFSNVTIWSTFVVEIFFLLIFLYYLSFVSFFFYFTRHFHSFSLLSGRFDIVGTQMRGPPFCRGIVTLSAVYPIVTGQPLWRIVNGRCYYYRYCCARTTMTMRLARAYIYMYIMHGTYVYKIQMCTCIWIFT